MSKDAMVLRSESGEFCTTYEAGATSICRRYVQQSPDVTLACETTRLDVLASVLRRDSMSPAGAAVMPDGERTVLIEMLADAAAEVHRLAQLTEAYVSRLQAAGGCVPSDPVRESGACSGQNGALAMRP